MTHSISITWDHPRMCGEHIVKHVRPCSKRGSSPHVRGARIPSQRQGRLSGIIPACAGSTPHRLTRCTQVGDHPRMCGEHMNVTGYQETPWGSSPHVRGAPFAFAVVTLAPGIIPACAGSTQALRTPQPPTGDHPRMCGEHSRHAALTLERVGSSPHVRGAQNRSRFLHAVVGIIPACAGSTPYSRRWGRISGDHPRMCGEHLIQGEMHVNGQGSSPHVRGAPRSADRMPFNAGIIPACAGSTSPPMKPTAQARDHPRMCGEHPPPDEEEEPE